MILRRRRLQHSIFLEDLEQVLTLVVPKDGLNLLNQSSDKLIDGEDLVRLL
jgi:hypothetical protein